MKDFDPTLPKEVKRKEDLARDLKLFLPDVSAERPLAVVFLDGDGFKRVNDVHGHLIGDAVIARLFEIIVGVVGAFGSVYAVGGDEGVVLLPNRELEEARATAERIRACVQNHDWRGAGLPAVTISVGVTVTPGSTAAARAEQIVADADTAMLEGKRAGGNVTCVFDLDMRRQKNNAPKARGILNLNLLDFFDKKLRFVLLVPQNYVNVRNAARNHDFACTSVIGKHHLIASHVGPGLSRMKNDLMRAGLLPVGRVDGDPHDHEIPYFSVDKARKFRGRRLPEIKKKPSFAELAKLVALARDWDATELGIVAADRERFEAEGWLLGHEPLVFRREFQLEALTVIGLHDKDDFKQKLFVREVILPLVDDARIRSLYMGASRGLEGDYLLHVVCAPDQLYELLEEIHERASRFWLLATTHTYVATKRWSNQTFQGLLIPTVPKETREFFDACVRPFVRSDLSDQFERRSREEQIAGMGAIRELTDLVAAAPADVRERLDTEVMRLHLFNGILARRNEDVKPICETILGIAEKAIIAELTLRTGAAGYAKGVELGVFPKDKPGLDRLTYGQMVDALRHKKLDQLPGPAAPCAEDELILLTRSVPIRNDLAHHRLAQVDFSSMVRTMIELLREIVERTDGILGRNVPR